LEDLDKLTNVIELKIASTLRTFGMSKSCSSIIKRNFEGPNGKFNVLEYNNG
jgi:hypothetical protein